MDSSPDTSSEFAENQQARRGRRFQKRSTYYQNDTPYGVDTRGFTQRSKRRTGCLAFLLIIVALLGTALWTNIIPIRSWIHTGPITISVAATPTLFIDNEARNNSELRQREAAPLRIRAGSSNDTIVITGPNLPWLGDLPITYRQSADHIFTFLKIDYKYRGTIEITLPAHTNIKLDSYENGADIKGITGRMVLNTYKANLQLEDCILTGPSLVKNYQGTINLQNITLQAASSFLSYQGDITYQGNLAPEGHHFFYTYAGKIIVSLPAASTFTIDASNYQGEISTDFPGLHPLERELHGTVGLAPHAHLHLYSYQQSIQLLRQKGV